ATRFSQYLREARPHDVHRSQVLFTDGWLFTGRPLDPRNLAAAGKALGKEIVYGEETPDGIRLVTRGSARALPPREARELFGRQRVAVTPAVGFQKLLGGVLEGGGRLSEIGLLQHGDFTRRPTRSPSPLRGEGALRVVRYGRLRLRPDGTEIGPVRPGDL